MTENHRGPAQGGVSADCEETAGVEVFQLDNMALINLYFTIQF